MIIKKNRIFITLFLSFLFLFSSFFCCFSVVKAQVKEDSGVLEDLSRDKNFNVLNYPENSFDYSINVIHLAEGESGSLFIYTYQPTGTKKLLNALKVAICTKDYTKYYTADNPDDNNSTFFVIYDLELLSYDNTLFKYRVKDYNYTLDNNFYTDKTFDRTLTRNYEISTIWRPFINGVDTALDSLADGTIKGLEVGKMFSITSATDGSNNITSKMVDVISVTDKHVGSIRYDEGDYLLFEEDVDAWYVSFSTNKKMETLLEVDIYYNCTDISKRRPSRFTSLGKVWDWVAGNYHKFVSEYAVLQTFTCEDEGSHGGGWFIQEKDFKRIISVSEFLSGDGGKLPLNVKTKIMQHQWVIRFAETLYSESNLDDSYSKSVISNVALLRFKFETDGVVYNLGVIDDMTTPKGEPEVKIDGTCAGMEWKQILSLVALVVLLILLAPILPYVLSFVFFLLSLPFKFIGFLSKIIKKDGGSNGKKT